MLNLLYLFFKELYLHYFSLLIFQTLTLINNIYLLITNNIIVTSIIFLIIIYRVCSFHIRYSSHNYIENLPYYKDNFTLNTRFEDVLDKLLENDKTSMKNVFNIAGDYGVGKTTQLLMYIKKKLLRRDNKLQFFYKSCWLEKDDVHFRSIIIKKLLQQMIHDSLLKWNLKLVYDYLKLYIKLINIGSKFNITEGSIYQILGFTISILFSIDTLDEYINDICKTTEKLDKKYIIIIDDFNRISNEVMIADLLGFVSLFEGSNKIKFILIGLDESKYESKLLIRDGFIDKIIHKPYLEIGYVELTNFFENYLKNYPNPIILDYNIKILLCLFDNMYKFNKDDIDKKELDLNALNNVLIDFIYSYKYNIKYYKNIDEIENKIKENKSPFETSKKRYKDVSPGIDIKDEELQKNIDNYQKEVGNIPLSDQRFEKYFREENSNLICMKNILDGVVPDLLVIKISDYKLYSTPLNTVNFIRKDGDSGIFHIS